MESGVSRVGWRKWAGKQIWKQRQVSRGLLVLDASFTMYQAGDLGQWLHSQCFYFLVYSMDVQIESAPQGCAGLH